MKTPPPPPHTRAPEWTHSHIVLVFLTSFEAYSQIHSKAWAHCRQSPLPCNATAHMLCNPAGTCDLASGTYALQSCWYMWFGQRDDRAAHCQARRLVDRFWCRISYPPNKETIRFDHSLTISEALCWHFMAALAGSQESGELLQHPQGCRGPMELPACSVEFASGGFYEGTSSSKHLRHCCGHQTIDKKATEHTIWKPRGVWRFSGDTLADRSTISWALMEGVDSWLLGQTSLRSQELLFAFFPVCKDWVWHKFLSISWKKYVEAACAAALQVLKTFMAGTGSKPPFNAFQPLTGIPSVDSVRAPYLDRASGLALAERCGGDLCRG